MLIDADAECMHNANYVCHRCPLSGNDKTPLEIFFGKVLGLAHRRVFGATAFVCVLKGLRQRLRPKSQEGVFVV
jgi:hypothetical protein